MCDEFFNLENRLVFGFPQHLLVIFGGEMSLEAMDTAQVNFAASNHGEKDWEASSRARGADALAGCRLGHVVPRYEKSEPRTWMGTPVWPTPGADRWRRCGGAGWRCPRGPAALGRRTREQRVIVQCFERGM